MITERLRALSAETHEMFPFPMRGEYLPLLNLSTHNWRVTGKNIWERPRLTAYVNKRLEQTGAPAVWGGYLEQRLIYSDSPHFHSDQKPRCIHLGVDFWTDAGTRVAAPIAGIVHSFANNEGYSNYGGTVILRHEVEDLAFHSLYGHLSVQSVEGLEVGQKMEAGETVGWLGAFEENGNWPPHLHFQLIVDMGEWSGDYPGACAIEDMKYYQKNCPDPRFLLGI
ncbi:MAG: peptidoglycan DD-metalloendopeptidase family protein [Bacteroidota bacterium]